VYSSVKKDKIAMILACESSFLFLNQLDILKNWQRLGIRVLSLTHGEGQEAWGDFAEMILSQNQIINPSKMMALQISETPDNYLDLSKRDGMLKRTKGLTEFGQTVLEEIERLDIVCDLSHANDATFWDAIEHSDTKICCTHSNCATLCPHTRNLTDNMMEALADKGGIMGLCFFGEFIDQKEPTLNRFVDHIIHALDIMGSNHVGIGSDYDGVPPDCFMAIENPGKMSQLWTALTEAGVKKSTQKKIAHQNFLNIL
jgi:microsomal dipeptidase-like Zn-dependent dipeptidase